MSDERRETVDYGRCPECGYLMLPVLQLSPCGHDSEPEIAPLTEEGIVYTWTKVHAGDGERIIAMADFFDGELRVNAPFAGSSVVIGDRVRLYMGETTPYELRRVG